MTRPPADGFVFAATVRLRKQVHQPEGPELRPQTRDSRPHGAIAAGPHGSWPRRIMDAGPKFLHSNPDRPRARAGHLMFIALDKLQNQGLEQAIIVVPEMSIGASFHAAKRSPLVWVASV
jgi:hypothetical protein